jgi:hypothetical protein
MSRKAQRQLREALTTISHLYMHPLSQACRAKDIITPEVSPQSTPRSVPAELPVIHKPTPIHFAGVINPSPVHLLPKCNTYNPKLLDPKFPTLFHCLATTANHLELHIGVDQLNYQDWYLTIKKTFSEKAIKVATTKVEEKWLCWKANQIDHCAVTQETKITNAVRTRNTSYFTEMAMHFSFQPMPGTLVSTDSIPTTGSKCLALGTIPRSTPSTLAATRI